MQFIHSLGQIWLSDWRSLLVVAGESLFWKIAKGLFSSEKIRGLTMDSD
jgi:hypothetical protein